MLPHRLRNYLLLKRGILVIGNYSYGTPEIKMYKGDRNKVSIGHYCSISSGVVIFVGGEHRTDWVSTFPFRIIFGMEGACFDGHPTSKGNVTIGNDVWIGHGVTILSGSDIGHGAVLGAGSVVSGRIRPYAIVAGNPAKEIRRRFSDQEIDQLLEFEWWNWPLHKIKENVILLNSTFLMKFFEIKN